MNLDNFNFDALTKETLALSENLQNEIESSKNSFDFKLDNFKEKETYPESAGLIYRITKGVNTFSLRGFASENIAESMQELEEENPELIYELKYKKNEDFIFEDIRFFEVDFIEQAEIIIDEIFNRRFPVKEEVLCNLSDPGFSWWMDDYGNGFSIYYKSHGIDREKDLIKLGPIGDSKIAEFRFQKLFQVFSKLFQDYRFDSDSRGFELSCESYNPVLSAFKNIFLNGNLPSEDILSLRSFDRTLYYFLWEIATMRKFWMTIEDQIQTK